MCLESIFYFHKDINFLYFYIYRVLLFYKNLSYENKNKEQIWLVLKKK